MEKSCQSGHSGMLRFNLYVIGIKRCCIWLKWTPTTKTNLKHFSMKQFFSWTDLNAKGHLEIVFPQMTRFWNNFFLEKNMFHFFRLKTKNDSFKERVPEWFNYDLIFVFHGLKDGDGLAKTSFRRGFCSNTKGWSIRCLIFYRQRRMIK